MVKLLKRAGRCSGRYIALAAVTTTLVACGGGGGDADTDPNADTDGNGIPDFIDEQDLDGDLIINRDDDDADGDGILDAALDLDGNRIDRFIDLDGDGLDDVSLLAEGPANFDEVTADMPCGSEAGSVAYGSAPQWNNNCQIRRSNVVGEGQFADSLYAVGIQRIVYCSGFGTARAPEPDEDPNAESYTRFADGEYGPISETAMQQFQASTPGPVTDDGVVGPQSWAKLQARLVRLTPGQIPLNGPQVTRDSYGFSDGRCEGIPLFYQEVTLNPNGTNDFIPGGWRLARNAPNAEETVPFSIDKPFGRL